MINRDFLKGLGLETDISDKIMAEYGKFVTEEKSKTQELENKIKDYEAKITDLEGMSKDSEKVSQELEALKKQIADEKEAKKQAEEEELLNNNINSIFEGKQFTSEYARVGLMNDIKSGLKKPENSGKGIQELFNELTKDKTDIFTNPNQLKDMPSMDDTNVEEPKEDIPMFF